MMGCATAKQGGWWWGSTCVTDGALTIPLNPDKFDANIKGAFWGGQKLTAAVMMIRPTNYQGTRYAFISFMLLLLITLYSITSLDTRYFSIVRGYMRIN